jgi:hypothetical protein
MPAGGAIAVRCRALSRRDTEASMASGLTAVLPTVAPVLLGACIVSGAAAIVVRGGGVHVWR